MKRLNQSIITQTVVRVSIIFIVALLGLTGIFLVFIWQYMQKNTIENKMEQLETIGRGMNEDFDKIVVPMISLGTYNSATWLMKHPEEKYNGTWMRNIRNMDDYLQSISLYNEQVLDILLISTDNQIVYCYSDTMKLYENYLEKPWFVSAVKGEELIKTAYHRNADFYCRNKKEHTVTCIYPVEQRGSIVGYVLLAYDLSPYVEYFDASDQKEGYLLLDCDGVRMLDYRESEIWAFQRMSLYKKIREEGKKSHTEFGNVYLCYELPACGWALLSEINRSVLLEPIVKLVRTVCGVILATIVALIVISTYLMKNIKKPLDELTERIQKFDVRTLPEKSQLSNVPRELSIISHKFDEMAEHTNRLVHEVYVTELAKKEMELEAMVNQINPHFLYNVFQLIQTEAVLADNQTIEEMIQALGNMMRYTMERKREYVTVQEEIRYIQEYLMFYKERFPNLFTYELIFDPELESYEMIKFILQPIVENCFKHGLKEKRTGGIIRIQIQKVDEDLIFQIWDNGRGIPAKRLTEIQERFNGKEVETGIGLINTNSRLRLVYGETYGISFRSEEQKFTEVTVKIKAERGLHV